MSGVARHRHASAHARSALPWAGRIAAVAMTVVFACGTAVANEATPSAADPALEARVMKVAEELRCLVCQNETIAASHADLAVDLRKQIRNQLSEGRSEQQILDFMVQRYGDFVLYRPALRATTALLWIGPFVLLLVAGYALARAIRGRQRASHAPLSPADARRARQLLDESPPGP